MPSRRDGETRPSRQPGGMGISLDCPDCGVEGWVDWKSLKNGIGCPKCGCQFIIGRNGQVISRADMEHTRFTCPRCKHAEAIPTALCGRGSRCPKCELPIALGPDKKLHEAEVAAELWREKNAAAQKASFFDRLVERFHTKDGHVRSGLMVFSGLLLSAVLVVASMAAYSLFDNSPETMAHRFTRTCLSGDWDAAEDYLIDNDLQRAQFQMWRSRYFTSIIDKFRPAGDRVSINVETLNAAPASRVFRVTINSPFVGSRNYIEHWRQENGRWTFDVAETLVQTMPTRPKLRPQSPPRTGANRIKDKLK